MTAGNHRRPHGGVEHIHVGEDLRKAPPAGRGGSRQEKPPAETPAALVGEHADVGNGAGVLLLERGEADHPDRLTAVVSDQASGAIVGIERRHHHAGPVLGPGRGVVVVVVPIQPAGRY